MVALQVAHPQTSKPEPMQVQLYVEKVSYMVTRATHEVEG